MPLGLPGQRRAAVLLVPEVCVCFIVFALSACLPFVLYSVAPLKFAPSRYSFLYAEFSFITGKPLSYMQPVLLPCITPSP